MRIHNIRDWTTDKHHVTDDYPYGGGSGMVMKPEPIFAAVEAVLAMPPRAAPPVILMTPQGRPFTQAVAQELSSTPRLSSSAGTTRAWTSACASIWSPTRYPIGDYVLTGGELPAMVVLDAVARLVPGVLDPGSLGEESHSAGLLEYPQYTRPPEFRGWAVPEMLLSGNHGAIARWRRRESLKRTLRRRPDLLAELKLSDDEQRYLDELSQESTE